MTRNALVAGATGLIGRELVSLLVESNRYNEVHIVTRRPYDLQHPKIILHVINFENFDKLNVKSNIHDVFVCLGTTIKKAGSKGNFRKVDYEYVLSVGKWAKENNAEKFVLISSMGANAQSKFNFYLRTKGQVEQSLQNLVLKSLIILRPSLLLGKREEFRFGEKISGLILKPLLPFMKGKMKKFKPVEARNVAAAMIYFDCNSDSQLRIVENDEILDVE
jgi:uncharacterized protein YbjT (DUF2867 family)